MTRTLIVLRSTTIRVVLTGVFVVGLVLSLTLAGLAPKGGDPELMYQPIKRELVRALSVRGAPVLE